MVIFGDFLAKKQKKSKFSKKVNFLGFFEVFWRFENFKKVDICILGDILRVFEK